LAERATFLLRDERDRQLAVRFVLKCPLGQQVKISKRGRSDIQNAAIHAALTDIADQLVWPPVAPGINSGELHDLVWWKRRCTLGWLIETKQEKEIIYALEGDEFAILLPHTSDLDVSQCAALREWILMFGATNGVAFKEKRQPEPPTQETDR